MQALFGRLFATAGTDGGSLPPGLYGFAWRASGRDQLMLVTLSAAVAVLAMAPLEIQRRAVNGMVEGGSLRLLLVLAGAYAAVALLQGALKYLMNYCRGRAGEDAIRELRRRVYCGTVHARDEERGGRAVAMVSSEVEPLGGFVGDSLSEPLVQVGLLASIAGYLLFTEPLMALVSLALLCPQLYFVPLLQDRINRRNAERTKALRGLGDQVVGEAGEQPGSGNPDDYGTRIDRLRRLRLAVFRLKFLMKFLINALQHLGTAGVLLLGGWLVLEGRTEVGTVVAFVTAMERLGDPWRAVVTFFRQLSDARVKYGLIRDALEGA